MARAGFTYQPADFADPLAPGGTWWGTDGGDGDLRETLATLFIHDYQSALLWNFLACPRRV